MAIKTEYRMFFEAGKNTPESSLEIAASGGDDDLGIFLSQPEKMGGNVEWIIQMSRQEALELKAILGVLTGTASHEEEVTVGVAS
jgi:hypothetical protein